MKIDSVILFTPSGNKTMIGHLCCREEKKRKKDCFWITRFKSQFVLFVMFLIFVFPLYDVENFSFREVEGKYEEWRLEQVFYARTLGLRINREKLEKIIDFSIRFDRDLETLLCWCYVESRFCLDAVSSAGACGLLQVMPQTAEMVVNLLINDTTGKYNITFSEREGLEKGYDLFDIDDNLLIALSFIFMLEECSNGFEEVLAKYYAGRNYRYYLSKNRCYVNAVFYKEPLNRRFVRSVL